MAGNWKMYKTRSEARAFLAAFTPLIADLPAERTVVLCGPFTCLDLLTTAAGQFAPGAQNVHWETEGAFTGEISAPMLVELGIRYAIVGHSERRAYFNETDGTVNKRLRAAQTHGLIPILCVGESNEQRQAGFTDPWIATQLEEDLPGIDLDRLVIAYEPLWAIGTGATCEATEANRVTGLIRTLAGRADLPILYGGSVKPGNIDELMDRPEIDGVLVGGASLDPESFARIVNYKAFAAT